MLNSQSWLTLMDYSTKYRVSLSTLRRRIKSGEIEHKFADGKYLIKESPVQSNRAGSETIAPPSLVKSQNQGQASVAPAAPAAGQDLNGQSAQSLLSEIKKAYSQVLQGKEQLIIQLKEEVADLKTLVRVLEDENNRLKTAHTSLTNFDLGLEI